MTGIGIQACGDGDLNPADSGLLDQLAGFVNKGGKLVVTGCNIFNEKTVGMWQQYATDHDITIVGSASMVSYGKTKGCQGVWVTLVPGGTAPTIINAD